MKIYIAGKISGLDFEEVKAKFNKAETRLKAHGFEVVNPVTGADPAKPWAFHMVKDIEMLLGCEAIYLLKDWHESRGARIERTIASELEMQVFSEKNGGCLDKLQVYSDPNIIEKLKSAIMIFSGLSYMEFIKEGKGQKEYFCRLIFHHFCTMNGIKNEELHHLLNRDYSTVSQYRWKYEQEMKFNRNFYDLATKIEKHLTK